jgi:hypothetical protein
LVCPGGNETTASFSARWTTVRSLPWTRH